VVAANHPSGLDPALVGAVHGRPVVFLALDELYGKHPLLRLALTGFGAIPIPRGGVALSALRTALEALAAGRVVGVFPEGRRSPTWGETPVRPGAAWLAVRSGVPLVPVALAGTASAVGMDNRFGPGPVTVTVGAPLRASGRGRPAVADLHERWRAWMEERLRR
jgi:1-acyl-sn-glycerol-3-phosphate acyltransferase